MTTQEILDGTFAIDDEPTRQELKDLLYSLHKVTLCEHNVDNIIHFLNYCKQHKFDVIENVEWYLIDNMDNKNYEESRKIALDNRDIVDRIQKRVVKQEKEHSYPDDYWNSGWTRRPLEEVKNMKSAVKSGDFKSAEEYFEKSAEKLI